MTLSENVIAAYERMKRAEERCATIKVANNRELVAGALVYGQIECLAADLEKTAATAAYNALLHSAAERRAVEMAAETD